MMRNKVLLGIILSTFIIGLAIPSHDLGGRVANLEQVNGGFYTSQEYNISSYLDFSKAAGNIILEHLCNYSDGSIFRSADSMYEMITLLPSLADYYWAICGLARLYEVSKKEGTPNSTLSIMVSRAANRMVELFLDSDYPGYGVNLFSPYEARTTKRAGVQSYAYDALRIAEKVNSSLDFTNEKLSAIRCLTDMLYDPENGGLYFYTLRNGSLKTPDYMYEVYPNDGKRLDHLALGIIALYNAGEEFGNSTYTAIANASLRFMIDNMRKDFQGEYYGFKLAVNRTGGSVEVGVNERSAEVVVSDLNAYAISALLTAYNYTGDSTYLSLAESTMKALLKYNWDTEKGGWFAEVLEGEPYDSLDDKDVKYYKYTEIQFQMVLVLQKMYEITDLTFYVQMTIDILELVLSRLWDTENGGFWQNGNQEWQCLTDSWKMHHTLVQGVGIIALERVWSYGLPIISSVRINPVSPRPTDEILVSCIALDSDGIDCVWVNYTCDINGTITQGIIVLSPNPEVGGIYNSTFGCLNDSARVNFLVYANDTKGVDFVAGSYYFIVRADIFEPILTLRNIYPSEPKSGDEIILEFTTYEFPLHSSLVTCALNWKVNDGSFTKVNMTWVSVDGNELVWQVDLGVFGGGDVISYYAEALDESGNFGTSPFYRLKILGQTDFVTPLVTWQILAMVGLIAAPGFGFAYIWSRRRYANEQQRILKKEARRRGRRARGKSRSRSGSHGGT